MGRESAFEMYIVGYYQGNRYSWIKHVYSFSHVLTTAQYYHSEYNNVRITCKSLPRKGVI